MQRPLNKPRLHLSHTSKQVFDPFRLLASKQPKLKSKLQNEKKFPSKINDQNLNNNNIQEGKEERATTIGLTKRIKKQSIVKKNPHPISLRASQITSQIKSPLSVYKITIEDKTFNCFPDTFLHIPQQMKDLNREQKQDNDCDSDWDQVQAGARRLFRSLKQRILEQKSNFDIL